MKLKIAPKHILTRILILIAFITIILVVGRFTLLNKGQKCATAEVLSIIVAIFFSYCFWTLGLLVELYFLNKKRKIEKRNSNIIATLLVPFLFLLEYLYLQIVEIFY